MIEQGKQGAQRVLQRMQARAQTDSEQVRDCLLYTSRCV